MTDVELMLSVGGLLLGMRLPWRVGVRGRLAAIFPPTADRSGSGGADDSGRALRGVGPGVQADSGRSRVVQPVDVVLLLDLLDVAVSAGASVPRALEAVGEAVGGDAGAGLVRVAVELLLGASWRAAWAGASVGLEPVAETLEGAWLQGATPGPSLRARAGSIRRDRRRDAREAAGRLGVHLVLPLGLCFLPAFVLLGLVPVLVSLAAGFVM
jgi:pilus assembly protein TadC